MKSLIANSIVIDRQRLNEDIDWSDRLIGILGSRGAGKTNTLLQRLDSAYESGDECLYVSMIDPHFKEQMLSDFAARYVEREGKILLIDDLHNYPNWAVVLKNIYDFYRDLRIVFTASDSHKVSRQLLSLSWRIVSYEISR